MNLLLVCSAPVAPFNPPPEQGSEPPGEWEYDPVAENDDDENEDSGDPNALDGPAGYGTQGFIQATGTLPYTIDFENDGSAATQDVIVAEQLDPNLQWAAFQLGSFGFGPVNVAIPAGLTQYQTTLSYQNTDGSSLNVQVSLDFNVSTGLLTATFVSLDPLAGQAPAGVFDGFLYPESQSLIDSEGYVQYTVPEKAGLTTGTTINQQASVVFDTNASLNTAIVTNTIDAGPPTSSVVALPAVETSSDFTVSWSGQDDTGGSGIAGCNIYVSNNGGAYTLWQSATTQTSAALDDHLIVGIELGKDPYQHRHGSDGPVAHPGADQDTHARLDRDDLPVQGHPGTSFALENVIGLRQTVVVVGLGLDGDLRAVTPKTRSHIYPGRTSPIFGHQNHPVKQKDGHRSIPRRATRPVADGPGGKYHRNQYLQAALWRTEVRYVLLRADRRSRLNASLPVELDIAESSNKNQSYTLVRTPLEPL